MIEYLTAAAVASLWIVVSPCCPCTSPNVFSQDYVHRLPEMADKAVADEVYAVEAANNVAYFGGAEPSHVAAARRVGKIESEASAIGHGAHQGGSVAAGSSVRGV